MKDLGWWDVWEWGRLIRKIIRNVHYENSSRISLTQPSTNEQFTNEQTQTSAIIGEKFSFWELKIYSQEIRYFEFYISNNNCFNFSENRSTRILYLGSDCQMLAAGISLMKGKTIFLTKVCRGRKVGGSKNEVFREQ